MISYFSCALLALAYEKLQICLSDAPALSSLSAADADRLTVFAGYFITAQVGMIATLTVAVSIVALLNERAENGSSNMDVRLYYNESHTREVATSSIVLAAILTAQLFWPLEGQVHRLLGLNRPDIYERFLTAAHAVWLIFNLSVFLRFLKITLDFVDPENRASMRLRHVATEVIPQDVARRLLTAYYVHIPSAILSDEELKRGPYVTFGAGLMIADRGSPEIVSHFGFEKRLTDVWLRPLNYVLTNWQRRTRELQGAPTNRFGEAHWDGHLAVPVRIEIASEGRVAIVTRDGGAELSRIEKWLIWGSFRFRRQRREYTDHATPTAFIEQLVTALVRSIDSGSISAFEGSFKELTALHRFLLEAQVATGEDGKKINLAEFNDGPFIRPDQQWAREYRRAHTAAVGKLTSDPYFIDGVGRLPVALWPRNPKAYTESVLDNILDLGRHQVVAFEDWVTKRAIVETPAGGEATNLAGSDLRAYEEALISFVSAWEFLETTVSSSFTAAQGGPSDDAAYWAAARDSWPSLRTHLRNSAYFLMSAVWNDDQSGAARYGDLLLRWLHPFYRELDNEYLVRDSAAITPDLLEGTLPAAQADMQGALMSARESLNARSIYGAVLREAHNDVICVSSAVMLYWYATKRQPAPIAAKAAMGLIRREPRKDDGTDLISGRGTRKKTTFRLAFDLLVHQALHPRFNERHYGAHLEGLIQTLNDLSSPRMVPGRIYSGVGMDGFDTIKPELLAIMAGSFPSSGDDGALGLVTSLLENNRALDNDQTLRQFSQIFTQYRDSLNGDMDGRFGVSLNLLDDTIDLDEARSRLRAIFTAVIDAVESSRLGRLRNAPLDVERIRDVVDTVCATLLANDQPISAFAPTEVKPATDTIDELERSFRSLDRGTFTSPPMSPIDFGEIRSIIVDVVDGDLTALANYSLARRTKVEINVPTADDVKQFFECAIEHINSAIDVGNDPVLMVPSQPFGVAVAMASQGFPEQDFGKLNVSRDERFSADHGYVGSINGVPVFNGYFNDIATCCARDSLLSIEFRSVGDTEDIFRFELQDVGNPSESTVKFWIAPRFTWDDRQVLWFTFAPGGLSDARV